MTKRLAAVLGLVAALTAVGCGGGKDTKTSKVRGKVTLAGGKPLSGGRIDFHAASSGNMVSGQIKADGSYEADGVPRGVSKISIENSYLKGIGKQPKGLAPMPGSDLKYVPVKPKYANFANSGLTTTVQENLHHYDVQLE